MKIIAGEFGGRIIGSPKGDRTRPTTSQVRACVFNICQNHIEGASFLDLFAGSGAMGLEAISRGAKEATFVDNAKEACTLIRQNIKALGVESKCHLFMQDTLSCLHSLHNTFDICYIDPPYGTHVEPLLQFLDTSTLLAPHAYLFIEEGTKTKLSFDHLTHLQLSSARRMGDTMLYCMRRSWS